MEERRGEDGAKGDVATSRATLPYTKSRKGRRADSSLEPPEEAWPC